MLTNLIITLTKIKQKPNLNPDIRSKASNFISYFLKYETILIAHMYMKIFQITGPLSKYLQSSKLDLLKCQQIVTNALVSLKNIQRSMEDIKVSDKYIMNINNEIVTMADCFNLTVEEIQTKFQIKRISKKKKIFNYEKRRSYCYQCYP
jgi:hypothetical protein